MSQRKRKQENSFSLFGFLSESKVALLLILTNLASFVFLQKMVLDKDVLAPVILYPGNLLKGNITCLVTAGFIHHNWMHLGLNMLGVFIFGRIVEKRLGIIKTFYIYMGALVLSMLFSTVVYAFVLHKNVAIVGASGAVMGLISAAMLLAPFSITYEMILPLPTMVKGWLFFYADLEGFLGGEKDGVSHLAHLFGFLSIAFLVYFLSRQDKKLMRSGLLINIFSLIVFFILKHKLGY